MQYCVAVIDHLGNPDTLVYVMYCKVGSIRAYKRGQMIVARTGKIKPLLSVLSQMLI